MKIGITCYPTYGGSGVVATELGLKLAQRGHYIHFNFLRAADPSHRAPQPLYPFSMKWRLRVTPCLTIRRTTSRWLHAWRRGQALCLRPSARALRDSALGQRSYWPARCWLTAPPQPQAPIRHDSSRNGYHPGRSRPFLTSITRYSIEESDGVTAISQYLRTSTLKDFDIKNHIEVVYNFVNCDLYIRDADAAKRRKELRPPTNAFWCTCQIFGPSSGLLDVVEIFDRVRKKIPSKLLLVGDGPDRSKAEWLAVQKGIHNHVIFLGKQDRVQEKLAISRRDAAAQRTGIFRIGCAGSDGLQSRSHHNPCGRTAGGH